MRLLYIIHALSGGGAERVMATLINEQVRQGHEIALLADLRETPAYEIDRRINTYDISWGFPRKETNVWHKIYRQFRKMQNIRRTANQFRPDCVISFICEMNCYVVASLLFTKIPIICSEHTNVKVVLPRFISIFRKLMYPLASAVTVLTRHDLELWRNKLNNVVYMPNPMSNIPPSGQTKRERTILAVGRLNVWHTKGFDNLIRCWGQLCDEFPEWTLKIAGAGDIESTAYLKSIAEECHAKNVVFLGFRKDIIHVMQSSSIFCLSSRYEGLPMVLIEAMSSGCCCVAFNCETGPDEIILHEHNGLLAIDQNNDDLVLQLRRVLSDSRLRDELALNAQRTMNKYSLERISTRWNILFQKVLKKEK